MNQLEITFSKEAQSVLDRIAKALEGGATTIAKDSKTGVEKIIKEAVKDKPKAEVTQEPKPMTQKDISDNLNGKKATSLEDVRAAAAPFMETNKAKVKATLAKLGAQSFPTLDASKYDQFIKEIAEEDNLG